MKRIFACIGFSIALALIVLNQINISYVVYVIVGLAILLVASLLLENIRKNIVIPLCIASVLFASLLFNVTYDLKVLPQQSLDGQELNISFYYIELPNEYDDYCEYTVKTTSPQEMDLTLYSSEKINAKPFQLVNAKVKLSKTDDFANEIFLKGNVKEYCVTDYYISSIQKSLYDFRLDVINTLSKSLDGDKGAVATALVTGYKKNISPLLNTKIKFSGSAHIMAVSGFHLTVLTFGIFYILRKLNAKGYLQAIIGFGTILVCVTVAGFSKSIIRASIMLGVVLIGSCFKRRADTLNSLGIAIFLICLNPFAVADVGFQLSVTSVLALLVLYPRITPKYWLGPFTVPLSVMMFTFPIMYINFGYVSLSSLLSNVIIAPLGSISIGTSILSYVFIKLKFLSSFFVGVNSLFVGLLIDGIDFFSSIKGSVIYFPEYFGFVIAGVLLLFAVVYFLGNMKLLKPVSIISVILVVASVTFGIVSNYYSVNALVTKNGALAISYKNECVVYGVNNKNDYYCVRTFLSNKFDNIDAIICNSNKLEYSLDLADCYDCSEIIATDYSKAFDNFDVSAVYNEYEKYCIIDVNDVKIQSGYDKYNSSNILVADSKVTDNVGEIDLRKGDVVYTIYNNSFSVKRL